MLSSLLSCPAVGVSLSLINAIEKNDIEAVSEALCNEADVNSTVGEIRNTPLHLAVKFNREEISKALLHSNADVNRANRHGRSPLHEASIVGNVSLVIELIKHGANMNHLDNERWSALHFAAEKGHREVILVLLHHRVVLNLNIKNIDDNTPLHIAALNDHNDVAEMLINNGADAVTLNIEGKSPIKIMTERASDSLFFFRVVSLHDNADILAQMSSPIRFVNQIVKEQNGGLSYLSQEVYAMLSRQDPIVLRYLLIWYNSLAKAATTHSYEKVDLMIVASLVEDAVNEILSCDSMDDPVNVQRVLQPNVSLVHLKGLNTIVRNRELYRNQLLSFGEGGLINLCLRHRCKFIFGRQQISGFISQVFRAPARSILKSSKRKVLAPKKGQDSPVTLKKDSYSAQIPFISKIEETFKFNIFDPQRFGLSYSLRSCPRAMFGIELSSKILSIALIAYVGISVYGKKFGLDYNSFEAYDNLTLAECLLIVMIFANIFYELGQFIECDCKVSKYLSDEWNMLDSLSLSMLTLWFITRIIFFNGEIARVILALVAIPECTGLLRYLSVSKTLGIIVSTSRAMFYDLLAFLAVYVVCILGFGVFYYALFYGSDSFSSVAQTMSQMFQYTLTNFDFGAFNCSSEFVNVIAQVVLAIYLVLTAVLLLNLLIARMTNAYQRVDDKAVQEWSFAKTLCVIQYLTLTEKHPFCMLPAPLNLITTALYPFHFYYLTKSNISIAGTVSNLVLAYIGGPVRVYALLYCFRSGMKVIILRLYNRNKHRPVISFALIALTFISSIFVAAYLMLHVVIFYPLFAGDDLIERLDDDTSLSYLAIEQSKRVSLYSNETLQQYAGNSRLSSQNDVELVESPLNNRLSEESDGQQVVASEPSKLLSEKDILFTPADITRILRALGSTNSVLGSVKGDGESDDNKQDMVQILQKLEKLTEEQAQLRHKLDSLKSLLESKSM